MTKSEELRARIAARKAAQAKAETEAAPAPDVPEETPATEAPSLPPGIDPKVFPTLPEAVQRKILEGQAVKVNPPEVVQGAAESVAKSKQVASGEVPNESPKRKPRASKAAPATVDLTPVVEAIKAIPVPPAADLSGVEALLEKILVAQTETNNILGALTEEMVG